MPQILSTGTAMPQIFSRRADRRLRGGATIAALLLALGTVAGFAFVRSDRAWGVGQPAPQPIPFSHAVHAGGLGLDCRFCHARVETGAAAGMPAAETCLGCHRQGWNVTAQLAPLEAALALGTPVAWASVHRLPEHVRFHHAAHLGAGLTCATCHGAVETMPRTVRTETLSMGWCLDCHRAQPVATPVRHAGIAVGPLTGCSTCHR
jgi:hypothetical protein